MNLTQFLSGSLGLSGPYKPPAATPTANLKPAARAGGQALPYPGYLTPQQLASQARAQAEAALAPARSAIQSQMTQNQAYAKERAAIISGLYSQLAQMQQPLAGQVQGIYSGAAHDQTAFAKGYSDALQQALGQNADAINKQLAVAGAAPGQMQTASPAVAAGNVLYGLGGAIPADAMTREGAAFSSAAALMPSSTFGRGILDVRAMLNQSDADQQKLQAQLDSLAAQEPDLVMRATATLQAAQSQAAQLAATGKYRQQQLLLRKYQIDTTNYLKSLALGQATKKEAFSEWVAEKRLGLAEQNQSFNQWAKRQGLIIQGQRVSLSSQKQQHVRLPNGKVANFDPTTGTYTDPATGKPIDPNIGAGAAGAKPLSPAVRSKIVIGIRQAANGYYGYIGTGGARELPKVAKVADLLKLAQAAHMTLQQFKQDPEALRKAGIIAVHVADSPNQDPLVNKVYFEVIDRFGVSRQQAFDLVALLFPGWGTRNRTAFFPKGEASQGGAISIKGATAKDAQVVALVKQYLGTPYVWGGEAPGGFDCSGLLQYVWSKIGVSIPRTTYDQWDSGVNVQMPALRPGDAVFFRGSDPRDGKPGHVGMYIGGGRFIEAPGRGKTVRISYLLGRSDYMGARRWA